MKFVAASSPVDIFIHRLLINQRSNDSQHIGSDVLLSIGPRADRARDAALGQSRSDDNAAKLTFCIKCPGNLRMYAVDLHPIGCIIRA